MLEVYFSVDCTEINASSESQTKVKGCLSLMKRQVLITFMLFMTDIIILLSKLSLTLQDTTASASPIKNKLDTTISIFSTSSKPS